MDRNDANIVPEYDHKTLESLLEKHSFIIQATLTGNNFLLNYHLFHWNKKIYYMLGMHPEEVTEETNVQEILDLHTSVLTEYGKHPSLVGIGEVGLDYYWSDSPITRVKQAELFQLHIDLAIQHNLPIAVHIRDKKGEHQCMEDALTILEKNTAIHGKFVVHCFTGNQADAMRVLAMGGYLGFGGIVTYKSGLEILAIAQSCPADKFLLETDLPFLAPASHRGKTCLPEYVYETAEKLSLAKDLPVTKVWDLAHHNAKQLFTKLTR